MPLPVARDSRCGLHLELVDGREVRLVFVDASSPCPWTITASDVALEVGEADRRARLTMCRARADSATVGTWKRPAKEERVDRRHAWLARVVTVASATVSEPCRWTASCRADSECSGISNDRREKWGGDRDALVEERLEVTGGQPASRASPRLRRRRRARAGDVLARERRQRALQRPPPSHRTHPPPLAASEPVIARFEPRDGGVETLPQVFWPAPAGVGPELVWRRRILGSGHRPPQQPGSVGVLPRDLLGGGGVRQVLRSAARTPRPAARACERASPAPSRRSRGEPPA